MQQVTLQLLSILVIGVILTIIPLPRFKKNKWFYTRYLLSKRWKKKRVQRYKIDKGICQVCGEKVAFDEFECHHTTYKLLGNEPMKHLRTVHKHCHRKIDHRKIK